MSNFLRFIFVLACFFILPWWVSFLISIVFLMAYDSFYWLIVIGLLVDVVYSAADYKWFGLPFFFTILSLIIVWAGAKLKQNMLIYN